MDHLHYSDHHGVEMGTAVVHKDDDLGTHGLFRDLGWVPSKVCVDGEDCAEESS